ncbi:Leucine rich repeat [Carpediemonas membranifera]|uniref:Leucine rich repeat n=1 Tax=Carpediemonas membranifera TaxID=201153 RepID=A0A8J6AWB6_9EUKA|nr:Leucine rich repeat [Carpediemonas membranifera]|eukprot:KAG9396466.1 Leucine rich repeat [Carpediemonas membranifera]
MFGLLLLLIASVLAGSATNAQCLLNNEYTALSNIYTQLGGLGWTNNMGWSTTINNGCPCHAITGYTDTHGLQCGVEALGQQTNRVTEVLLRNNNLVGSFPDISGLSELVDLDMRGNSITCVNCGAYALPTSLGTCAKLTSVNVARNKLNGVLPESIGALPLTYLDVNNNLITAMQSSMTGWANLETLDVSYNALTALPNAMSTLTALTTLDISDNAITALPAGFSGMKALQYFTASNNKLTSLPADLDAMTGLIHIRADSNRITALPDNLANLGNLQFLDVGDNLISDLSTVHFPPQLMRIDVDDNQIKDLPEGLLLTDLTVLNVSNNALSAIPAMRMPALAELDAHDNQINAVAETLLASTAQLTLLDLSQNDLTTLPSISHNTQLSVLKLHQNKLTTVPDISSCPVTWLDISRNKIGTIPEGVWQDTKLLELDVSYNPLATLPDEIGELTQLKTLRASSCKISKISENIIAMQSLETLDVSKNYLEKMPTGLSLATSLKSLDLSYNNLAQFDISNIKSLRSLETLIMDGNPFGDKGLPALSDAAWIDTYSCRSCHIADTFEKVFDRMPHWLHNIDLAFNQITGEIPSMVLYSISSGNIESLDLSDNYLHGWVPEEFNLPEADRPAVSLSGNRFFCPIPSWATWTGASNDDCLAVSVSSVRANGRATVQSPAELHFSGSNFVASDRYTCAFKRTTGTSQVDPTPATVSDSYLVKCPTPIVELGETISPGEFTVTLEYDGKPLAMPHELSIVDACASFNNDCGGCVKNPSCMYCASSGSCVAEGLTPNMVCKKGFVNTCPHHTSEGELILHWAWMLLLLLILILLLVCLVSLCVIRFRPRGKPKKGKAFVETFGGTERESLLINENADVLYGELE